MFRLPTRTLLLFTLMAVVVAACSSKDDAANTATTLAPVTTISTVTTTTAASSTTDATTTTTVPTFEVGDSINGMPGDEELIDRRVIAVKIDNHIKARPQSGLQTAEMVWEILVEGGVSRFIALFHQTDSDYVGPNRSGRPTDAAVLDFFDPVFQVSGAQPWVQDVFATAGTRIVYDNGVATYRISSRSAPQNLYMSTNDLRAYVDDRGWADDNPGNLFTYGEPTESTEAATSVTIEFSDANVTRWEYDGETYLRFNRDVPHEWADNEGNSGQVSFDTVVALEARVYVASDPSGQGSSVPATDTVGSGNAYVFHGGTVVEGTWERSSTDDPFLLTTSDGETIVLAPGRIWVSLVPDTRPVTWK